MPQPTAGFPSIRELNRMLRRFAPASITADTKGLSPADRKALPHILDAARVMDDLYFEQLWAGNKQLRARLKRDRTPLGKARLEAFLFHKGPWSALDHHRAFLPGVPEIKPAGANFYPEDMTRQEFERAFASGDSATRRQAEAFFSVIRRDAKGNLKPVRYSREYKPHLDKAALLLENAAATTDNASLAKFLRLRAKAFRTDNYYASDIAWLDLNSPIDVTIGPYETYTDELFGYKAAFEAYVSIRDADASQRLKFFAEHLQEIEDNLPMDPKHRNAKIGACVPIVVVNLIQAAGDGAHGVMTAAYNLPNDERVVREKGTKQVMMRNVQRAKFAKVLTPIAKLVLRSTDLRHLDFEWFFTHILAHELAHGIGPHANVRQSLKELYSAIEEAKADSTGLFLLQHHFDHGLLPRAEEPLYTTFLASSFRTLRFGITEAHGKGMAIQMNWLLEKGGFRTDRSGRFFVDFDRIQTAVRDLVTRILTMEAECDYASAAKMIAQYGSRLTPEVERALAGLTKIPVDVRPA